MSKLRTKYESHEAKRALCAAYDLFLADERIIPVLPKLLGMLPPFPGWFLCDYIMCCHMHICCWQATSLSCTIMHVCMHCRQGLLQEEEAAHPGRPQQEGLGAADSARMPGDLHVPHGWYLHQHQVPNCALTLRRPPINLLSCATECASAKGSTQHRVCQAFDWLPCTPYTWPLISSV